MRSYPNYSRRITMSTRSGKTMLTPVLCLCILAVGALLMHQGKLDGLLNSMSIPSSHHDVQLQNENLAQTGESTRQAFTLDLPGWRFYYAYPEGEVADETVREALITAGLPVTTLSLGDAARSTCYIAEDDEAPLLPQGYVMQPAEIPQVTLEITASEEQKAMLLDVLNGWQTLLEQLAAGQNTPMEAQVALCSEQRSLVQQYLTHLDVLHQQGGGSVVTGAEAALTELHDALTELAQADALPQRYAAAYRQMVLDVVDGRCAYVQDLLAEGQ